MESSEPQECDKKKFQDNSKPLISFQSQEPHKKIILKHLPRLAFQVSVSLLPRAITQAVFAQKELSGTFLKTSDHALSS